ncbi:hypothetical protein OGAPHI_003154 [Ogataea philodendri]|uniref:Uncharacterized protein n=1 Tax=Ogataea philodendri TaxID=1378263 RepID=A0A9P8T6W0_9ASCO|nr:uncharacterized protein OGAPHI_003154 [Ogataea philodendri]KAH3667505.1 hypothetical protein OGAPHI_003154 [Ogataea philodendri]
MAVLEVLGQGIDDRLLQVNEVVSANWINHRRKVVLNVLLRSLSKIKNLVSVLREMLFHDLVDHRSLEQVANNKVSLISVGFLQERNHVELGNVSDVDRKHVQLCNWRVLGLESWDVQQVLVGSVESFRDSVVKQLRTKNKWWIDSRQTEVWFFVLDKVSGSFLGQLLRGHVGKVLVGDVLPLDWVPGVSRVNFGEDNLCRESDCGKRRGDNKVGHLRSILLGGLEDVESTVDGWMEISFLERFVQTKRERRGGVKNLGDFRVCLQNLVESVVSADVWDNFEGQLSIRVLLLELLKQRRILGLRTGSSDHSKVVGEQFVNNMLSNESSGASLGDDLDHKVSVSLGESESWSHGQVSSVHDELIVNVLVAVGSWDAHEVDTLGERFLVKHLVHLQFWSKRLLGGLVLDQLNGNEVTSTSDISSNLRVLQSSFQSSLGVGTNLSDVLNEVVSVDLLLHSKSNATVEVVRVVGLVAHNDTRTFSDGIDHLWSNHHTRKRHNSGSDGLTEGQKVWSTGGESELWVHEGEWVAASSQSTHDLIQNQKSTVLVTQSLDTVQVSFWRNRVTNGRSADSFQDDGSNLILTGGDNGLLQVVQELLTVLLLGQVTLISVWHKSGDLWNLVVRKKHLLEQWLHWVVSDRKSTDQVSVVGVDSGDELVSLSVTLLDVVLHGISHGLFVSLGTRADVHGRAEGSLRLGAHELGKLLGSSVGEVGTESVGRLLGEVVHLGKNLGVAVFQRTHSSSRDSVVDLSLLAGDWVLKDKPLTVLGGSDTLELFVSHFGLEKVWLVLGLDSHN